MQRARGPLILVLAATSAASAGGLAIVGGSPRAIGRAGASTVGDDGGGALLINPAALARRDTTRAQIGLALVDDAITWDPDDAAAPIARDQAGTRMLPLAAVISSIGPWVIGAGVMTAGAAERSLRDPRDVPQPEQLGTAFGYRYTGIAGSLRRDLVTVGAARRVGDSFAIGVAFGASRIAIAETRRLWAGFAGIRQVGDPQRDVQLTLAGTDGFVPSALVGLLFAHADAPLELGASIGWTARTVVTGEVAAAGTVDGPVVGLQTPTARLAIRQPVTARLGARYLGDRFVAELGGDLWIAPRSSRVAAWILDGVRVVDPSTVAVELDEVASRLSVRTHGAVRGALDVELVAGFLWATAGYAFTIGGTTESRLSPSFGDLGGHTLALGIEGTAGGFTYTVGWSRTLAVARRGGGAFALDNPFGAGDAPVAGGRFDGSVDQLGVLLDVELAAP